MPESENSDPECRIVYALALILGARSGDPALLEPCLGPVKAVSVGGGPPYASVVSWIPTAGPVATFSLCHTPRWAPAIRGAHIAA
jgi:hypothetical protein